MADENVGIVKPFPKQEITYFGFLVGYEYGGYYLVATLQTTLGEAAFERRVNVPIQVTTYPGRREYLVGKRTGRHILLENEESEPYPQITFSYGMEEEPVSLFSNYTSYIPHELYNAFSRFLEANRTITGPVHFQWGENKDEDNPEAPIINANNPQGGGSRIKRRKTRRAKAKRATHAQSRRRIGRRS